MLTLEKRKLKGKDGKVTFRYYIRGTCPYTGEHVRESLKTGDRSTAADKFAIELERRRQRGLRGDAGTASFAECVVYYLDKGGSDRFLDPILDFMGTMPVRDITDKTVSDFIAKQYPNAKPSTIVRQAYAPIEAVINAACAADPPMATPRKFHKPKVRRAPPQYLKSDDNLEAILRAIPDVRRRAGVLFMSFSGARSSEVARVMPDDHDPQAATIMLAHTKNGDARLVPLPDFVNEIVAALDPPDRSKPLFGFPSRFAVYDEIKAASKRAGVPFLSPHKLGRHSFAARLLRSGMSLAGLKEAGRWKSNNAVMFYAHLEKSQVDREMRGVSTSLDVSQSAPKGTQALISLKRKPLRSIRKSGK
jgi:integrase